MRPADVTLGGTMMPLSINARFRGRRITGVERYAIEISRRLPGEWRDELPPRGLGSIGGHLWEQLALPIQARGRLLWSPCNTGPLRHAPHVVTIHDAAFADRRECFSPRFAAWYNWLLPRLARNAVRVITVSEFSRDRLSEVCDIDREKIAVVPNGVDERFRPPDAETVAEVRERLGLPPSYVLGVGSLEPRKNLAGILTAWAIVRSRFPATILAIAGCSNDANFRGSGLAQSDLTAVRLLGYVEDRDLPSLYAGASVFAYPSTYEGFGLPPLEAMACGTPVVCSNTTALPGVVGDSAELADPTDATSFAEAISRLLGSDARSADLRRRGFARAAMFTWDRAAAETAAVLETVADYIVLRVGG